MKMEMKTRVIAVVTTAAMTVDMMVMTTAPIVMTCVALIWATHKLRHYMLAYKVLLITRMDPLKYLMEKLVQDRKTAR